ncbi:MAG: hypothetical protein LW825_00740 [Candidatus Jidaibacter sp.]|jgi:hypothetical protein|nr:hypothetical protein [Candidatus Jidaibacter sp.]
MSKGFVEWLKGKGVSNILEDFTRTTTGLNRNRSAAYVFPSREAAEKFIEGLKSFNNNPEEIVGRQHVTGYAITISSRIQQKLKEQYLKENPQEKSQEQVEAQLELIALAKNKIMEFNKLSQEDVLRKEAGAYYRFKAFDKIGMMAKLLRNKEEDGWYEDMANTATEIAMLAYQVSNFNTLSKDEHKKLTAARELMMGKITDNNVEIGGLKHSAEFTASGATMIDSLVKEYTSDYLNGGYRMQVNPNHRYVTSSLRGHKEEPNTYYQQRFFPDADGKSETDTVVIHAGGMANHSAMRILKKEKSENAVGGYRYYYTKADGGGGLEIVNEKEYYGIYTTEVQPAYRKGLGNKYIELTPEEIAKVKENKVLYQRYMQDTLQVLLETELTIERYKNPNLSVDNGESERITPSEAAEWRRLDAIIRKARGEMVKNRSHITTIQLTGNCTVYSSMLTVGALAGVNLGYDMMQEAKRYNHHNLLWQLNKLERDLSDTKDIQDYIKKGLQFKDGDPLIWAIDTEFKIDGMPALAWVIQHNQHSDKPILIEGKSPVLWALNNPDKSRIEGMSFARYLQVYGVERLSNLTQMPEKLDLLSALIVEYDILLKQRPRNDVEIKQLEEFYKDLNARANFTDRVQRVWHKRGNNLSGLSDLLNQYNSTELALIIKSNALEGEFNDEIKKITLEELMGNLPIKEAHKMWKVGNKLENDGVNTFTYNPVINAIRLFIVQLKDLFAEKSADQKVAEGLKDFSKKLQSKQQTGKPFVERFQQHDSDQPIRGK